VSGNGWVELIVTGSIVVPVAITAVLAWKILRGAKNDPDEQRLKRAQQEAEAARRASRSR